MVAVLVVVTILAVVAVLAVVVLVLNAEEFRRPKVSRKSWALFLRDKKSILNITYLRKGQTVSKEHYSNLLYLLNGKLKTKRGRKDGERSLFWQECACSKSVSRGAETHISLFSATFH